MGVVLAAAATAGRAADADAEPVVRRAIAGAGDADKAKMRLDEVAGTFVCASGGRLLWRVSELIESTRHHRAQSFIHRFYIQKLGNPVGRLVHTERDTRVPFLAAVMGDGTLVFSSRGRLLWRTPDGKSLKRPGRLHVTKLYGDGVELKVDDYTAAFVPFKGRSLDMDAKVELGMGSLRHGDKLAWIARSTLHVYDLKSRKRTKVALEAELHPSYRVTAFDGQTAMASVYAFDVKTGRILGQKKYPKMPTHFAYVFAVRNRIGYLFREGKLRATDLTSLTGRSVPLLATKQRPPHFQDSEGIRVWNGKKWVLVKWLKKWPEE